MHVQYNIQTKIIKNKINSPKRILENTTKRPLVQVKLTAT